VDGIVGAARLERPMVIARMVARAPLMLVVLAAPGCFDVQIADPGPVVIDDFEDGDFHPAIRGFDDWICYVYNEAAGTTYTCDRAPGFNSTSALYLDARIVDPADGRQSFGGARLAVFSDAPYDVTPYRELVFVAKLESGSLPLPSEARLQVELGCSTVLDADGNRPGDLAVVANVAFNNTWKISRIPVSGFSTPTWATQVMGGPGACRQRVDEIRFTIDAQLADGVTGEGILTIDDITLQ
jgi:hypothetical protein